MSERLDKKSPERMVRYFRHCIFQGDLQGAVSCFDAEGVYIERDGQEVKGLDNIEKALESICVWKPKISSIKHRVTIVDNHAIWTDTYFVKAKTPHGEPVEMDGVTVCLMKCNIKGDWLWLVDNPFVANDITK